MKYILELPGPTSSPYPFLTLHANGTVQIGTGTPVPFPKLAHQQWLPSELEDQTGFLLTNRSTSAVEKFVYDNSQSHWQREVTLAPISLKSTHNGLSLLANGSIRCTDCNVTCTADEAIDYTSPGSHVEFSKPPGLGQPTQVLLEGELRFEYLYINSKWYQVHPHSPASGPSLILPGVDSTPGDGPLAAVEIPIGQSESTLLGPVTLNSDGAVHFGGKHYGALQPIGNHPHQGYTASRGCGVRKMLRITPSLLTYEQESFLLRFEGDAWYRYLPTTGRTIDYLDSYIGNVYRPIGAVFDILKATAINLFGLAVLVFIAYLFFAALTDCF